MQGYIECEALDEMALPLLQKKGIKTSGDEHRQYFLACRCVKAHEATLSSKFNQCTTRTTHQSILNAKQTQNH